MDRLHRAAEGALAPHCRRRSLHPRRTYRLAHARRRPNLYVTEGEGRVQTRGEPAATIRPGDVAFTPSGEWHWHGAAPDHFMTHLSLAEGPATWGDHVTDDEYRDSTTT